MINNNDVLLYIVLIIALTRHHFTDLIAIFKDAQGPLFGNYCQKVPIFYMEERFTWSITFGFPSG